MKFSIAGRKRKGREAGQAMVTVAVSLVALLFAAGLAIDMGVMRYEKRRMQTAADSAAIAGAADLPFIANGGESVQAAAIADAASNGFKDTSLGGTATVTAVTPPSSGPHEGNAAYVEVQITQNQPTFFMRIAGGNFTTVAIGARAVAKVGSAPGCIYGLSSVNLVGGPLNSAAKVIANNCAVMDNGDFTTGQVSHTISASSIGIVGSGTCLGGWGVACSPSLEKIVPASDPFAYLQTQASPGNCAGGPVVPITGTQTLSPGSYPCGIQIAAGANVTFQSGVYVLGSYSAAPSSTSPFVALNPTCADDSGNTTTPGTGSYAGLCPSLTSLLIAGDGITVSGTGVTMYSMKGSVLMCVAEMQPGNDGTGCPDWSNITPSVSLIAPTTGDYAGVLFFQDPANHAPATIAGADDGFGNSTFIEGALYFPAAALNVYDLANLNWQSTYTILDALTVDLYGIVNLGSDYSSLPNQASPLKDAVLAE